MNEAHRVCVCDNIYIYICRNMYISVCEWVYCIVSCPSAYSLCYVRQYVLLMLHALKEALAFLAMSVTYSEIVAPDSGDAPSENSVVLTPKGRCSTMCFPSLGFSRFPVSPTALLPHVCESVCVCSTVISTKLSLCDHNSSGKSAHELQVYKLQ